MRIRLTRRRAHRRRLWSGRSTAVRETWMVRNEQDDAKRKAYRHPCPRCGASIVSVHMKKGGWAHFEGGKGLGSIKHPCLHLGEKLGRRRDAETLDLFESLNNYRS